MDPWNLDPVSKWILGNFRTNLTLINIFLTKKSCKGRKKKKDIFLISSWKSIIFLSNIQFSVSALDFHRKGWESLDIVSPPKKKATAHWESRKKGQLNENHTPATDDDGTR